jgi:hypothetical protein
VCRFRNNLALSGLDRGGNAAPREKQRWPQGSKGSAKLVREQASPVMK